VNVHIPRDKLTRDHMGYGFVEFATELDAEYAIKVMTMVKLYGKPIRVNKATIIKQNNDVGANLFIGNLDPEVDEKVLYDTFCVFGVLIAAPKVMRDESGQTKGYGFVNYDCFESSDAAIEAMNGQFLHNRRIHVDYAFKKDSKTEKHGSMAERILAANNPNIRRMNFLRSGIPPGLQPPPGPPPPFFMPPQGGPPPFGMPPLTY
jgi:splicing factor 3B subunit 4